LTGSAAAGTGEAAAASTRLSVAGVDVEHDVPVPMRDGTVLRADVYRPSRGSGYPVLLQRTPYDKRFAQNFVYQHPAWYARQGYVVAIQDVRGRYASDGSFYPGRSEASDGVDSIAWASRLPGGNGRVGSYGFSYPGMVQLLAAAEGPPALACAAPGFTSGDFYDGWTYQGGAFNHAFAISWVIQFLAVPEALRRGDRKAAVRLAAAGGELDALYRTQPLAELPILRETGVADYFFDWIEHEARDSYWQALSMYGRYDRVAVPCLHLGGWYDSFIEGTLRNYAELSERAGAEAGERQRLVVGPWYHIPWGRHVGCENFGPEADNDIDLLQLRWFDRWLKDDATALEGEAPVHLFMMGANRWRDADAWPPRGTKVEEWYLRSGGRASSLSGDGALSREVPADEPPDTFAYLPVSPVPSRGGRSCCLPETSPMGPSDQAPIEVRNDVLVYSTPPLEHEVEVTGSVELVLFAATDRPDTDWTAKLVDVDPEGRAINLCHGIVRARFRESLERAKPLEPGRVYEYLIPVGSTCNLFGRGHRIRLEVSSSNFPHYDVNPNTGAPLAEANLLDSVVATQVVFHDADRASRLRLPVAEP
jgi:putative CocE/NonD family hydrolase